MPVQPPGNIQLQQNQIDRRRRKSGMADDVVNLDRCRTERIGDPRPLGIVGRR